MIIFNKNVIQLGKPINTPRASSARRRIKSTKKISKTNKEFLRSLGFKI